MLESEYQALKLTVKERIRDMLGNIYSDMEDYAFERAEAHNMVVQDIDEDYEKVDLWVGFLLKEIILEWDDADIDPFI